MKSMFAAAYLQLDTKHEGPDSCTDLVRSCCPTAASMSALELSVMASSKALLHAYLLELSVIANRPRPASMVQTACSSMQ